MFEQRRMTLISHSQKNRGSFRHKKNSFHDTTRGIFFFNLHILTFHLCNKDLSIDFFQFVAEVLINISPTAFLHRNIVIYGLK